MNPLLKKILARVLKENSTRLSLIILVFWAIIACLPALFPELKEISIDLPQTRRPPVFSWYEPLGWFGYDSVGSSVLLQMIGGARVSLLVGISVVMVSALVGSTLGAAAGYWGGWVDQCVSRVMELLLAFPPLVLPIALAAVLGGGVFNTIAALCLGGWIGSAKIVRGQFRSLRNREFVIAAKALGASETRIIIYHLLPMTLSPLLIHTIFSLAGAILAEAGLSFLGLGLGDGYVSWGTLLNEARSYLLESPHLAIFPAAAILSLVVSLNFIGESLRQVLDKRAASVELD